MTDDRLLHLHERGYAVFPGFLDGATTARIRALTDRLLPPRATAAAPATAPGSCAIRSTTR